MNFTLLPRNYATLSRPVVYRFADEQTESTFDAELLDADTGSLLAARRFYRVAGGEWDVAPLLRRMVVFAPSTVTSAAFTPARDRYMRVVVRIGQVQSPVRTFLATERSAEPPALLTVLPDERIAVRGGTEEVTLLPEAASAELVYRTEEGLRTERFAAPDSGTPILFKFPVPTDPTIVRVDLTCRNRDGDELAVVRYVPVDPPAGGVRVAWRSRAGSVEHYHFPVRRQEGEQQTRTTVQGCDGEEFVGASARAELTVRSAFETERMLRVLGTIGTAPQLWVVAGDEYRPVEVVPESRVTVRSGTLRAVELTLRAMRPGEEPWN